jgi:16S rRNA processing protein RimM
MTENSREVAVAALGRPWGVRGMVHLDPRGADPGFLLGRGSLRVRASGRETVDLGILGWHIAGGRLIVRLEGLSSVEDAERFRGAEVLVEAGGFEPAPLGTYYPHQLVGLEVLGADGSRVGVVRELLSTGGADLLKIAGEGREVLIPFAETICRRVDLAAGTITIDPPEGLLDLAVDVARR